jgi:hypothetical protein
MQRKQVRTSTRRDFMRPQVRRSPGPSALIPPQFVPTLALAHKFRFIDSTGGSYTITRASLLNLIVTATSAITTVRSLEAVRLISVRMWGSPSGATIETISIEWLGENSPSTLISDSSMGVRPAHVHTSPPPTSSNQWWSISGSQETDDLFVIVTSVGTVLDISVEIRLVESEAPTAGPIPAGASLGQAYGVPLDGLGGNLKPVGFVNLP